ncbi:calcium-binding protein [Herbaspirillum robiniae]|nr:calcium-binding protein [Herbaspirillum robiniae]
MATASSSQANSAEKITGPVRVVMPDQAGSFQLNAPRGAVQHVQVVDVDMVLHMADGTKVVLAGGAMEAMDDKSKVKFSDSSANTGNLLDTVGKIPLAPNDQSRVLNSDPIASPDRVATDASVQSPQHVNVERNAASLGSDGVSQLSKIITDNAGSLTTNGTQNLSVPTQPTADASTTAANAALVASQSSPSKSDAPQRPVEIQAPPERPGVIPPTVVIDPSAPTQAVKLVNLATVTQIGNTLYGSAGIPTSSTDASLPQQFSTQVINAGNDVTTIYAAGNNIGDFTKVFNVNITGTGNVLSVIVSGVPSNMTIVNGTDLGGGRYSITVASGQKDFNLQLQYHTVEADTSSPVHQAFDLTFTTVVATSNGQLTLTDSRHVAVKDASAYGDLNYLDPATGDAVLVLPAQGAPHEVHAGNNAGTTIYGSNANDLLYGGTGNDTLIGGTGNTFFEGGAGADIITGGVNSTGTNVNTASYANSGAGVTVNLVTGLGTGGDAQGDVLTNIQNLKGSAYSDTFVANAAVNRLDGGSGGSDTVSYESSTSAVTVNLVTGTGSGGYAQGDTYTHIQNATGSAYDDVFIASTDANRFDGGGGSNTVSYVNSSAGVNINLVSGTGSGGAAAGDTYVRIQNVIGTAYDDTFVGSLDANSFDGGSGGNDTVSYASSTAGVSVNFVSGRGTGGFAEGDTYNHIQNVIGSAFDDVFIAGVDSKNFNGGSGGSDTVNYGASTGAVTVNMITLTGSGGYAQNNTYTHIQNIVGSSYSDTFIASIDANNFNGGLGGSDTVSYAFSNAAVTVDLYNGSGSGGYAQGDVLAHIQNVIGSNYDDMFIASADVNNFNGGGGSNTVSYFYSVGGVTVDLTNTIGTGTGGYYAAGDSFTNIQNIIGSVYDDTFVASADANSFDGGTGSLHNRVSYAASTDAVTVDLNYTNGTGTSGGYAAGDKLTNIQDLTGGAGDDTFVASLAENNFDGGAGSNRVSYAASNAAVTVDLVLGVGTGGYANNDTYTNIQNVTGSNFDDLFIASLAANKFDGGAGNNTVSYTKAGDGNGVTVDLFNGVGHNGFAAGDTYANIQNVIGTAYDDTFIADGNVNFFNGQQGSDTVSYENSTAGVTVNLVSNRGTGGFADNDSYASIENVTGSKYDDLIIASADANVIDGGANDISATPHNRVSYASSTAAVTVDLNYTDGTGTSGGYAQGDKLKNIQDLTGSQYDDTFVASAAANNFDGGINGNSGGAAAHNRVSYAASNAAVTVDLSREDGTGTFGGYATGDTLKNIQDLTGSQYNDTFIASSAANNFDGGVNNADGSAPHNRVSYVYSNAAVTVDLSTTIGTGTGGWAQGDTFTNIQDITGSQYNDTFIASAAANFFDGGANNADGSSPHNRVSYAASNAAVTIDLSTAVGTGTGGWAQGDTLTNIQDITGSQYNDTFIASAAANFFDGGVNNADGSAPHNRVSYAASNAAVTIDLSTTVGTGTGGWAQGDTFTNIQDVTGSQYNDTFIASAAANFFDGGVNNADGSAPHNRVSYAASNAAVTVDLSTTVGTGTGGWAQGDTFTNIQDVTGSQYNDTFIASAAVNYFDGGVNNADGSAPHNRVSYAASTAAVTVDLSTTVGTGTGGWADGDQLTNIQDLTGSQYNDTFIASAAANNFDGGVNNADGSAPHNRVSYANSNAAVTVDLSTTIGTGTGGWAQGDTLTNIQDLTGSIYNDTFVASAAVNYFDGGANNPDGTPAHNRVSYAGSNAAVTVDLSTTIGTGTGGWAQGDQLTNIQDLTGSIYNDTFIASAAANFFDGGANNPDGSAAHNRVSYANSNAAVTIDLSTTVGTGTGGWAQGDTLTNIQDLTGSIYNDTFIASAAANFFDGGANNPDGSAAHNRVSYAGSTAAVTVDLSTTVGTGTGGWAQGDTYTNIQDVTGGIYNDTFIASAAANNFDGGANNPDGSAPHNRVSYAASTGAVTVDLSTTIGTGTGGWAQGDTYTNIQDATGGIYNDTFIASAAANNFDGGANNPDGTAAHNRVSYAASDAGVTVDLAGGTGSGGWAANDAYVNIQDVTGSNFNDTFVASLAANNFEGLGGSNTVSYAQSTSSNNSTGVTVNLASGAAGIGNYAQGDTYSHIQNVIGSRFADTLTGADYDYANNAGVMSTLTGGAGADVLTAMAANRAYTYASYIGSGAVVINLQAGTGSGGDAQGDVLVNIDNVIGSNSDDVFYASSFANILNGRGGSDTVNYSLSTSSDGVNGVTVDLSSGLGSGNYAQGDVYTSIENAVGSAYKDSLTGFATVGTQSVLEGGAGADTITAVAANRAYTYASYAGSAAGVTIDLKNGTGAGGDAQGDTLVNIDNVLGSTHDDLFIASTAANIFKGNGGVDTVSYVNDTGGVVVDLTNTIAATGTYAAGDQFYDISNLIGGTGNDTFYASNIANSFDGGGGSNTVNYARSGGTAVTVDLYNHVGSGGYAAGDHYTNIQNVVGSAGNDTFYADAGFNTFTGGGSTGAGSGVAGTGDTVSYYYSGRDVASSTIVANLSTRQGTGGEANGDTYNNISNLEGSAYVDNNLTGDANGNTLTVRGSGTTNVLSGGGAVAGQTDVFNVLEGAHNTVTVGSGANMINVSAGSHSALGAQSDIVNKDTGTSNIVSINGLAGTTTLHFDDLGSSLTLSNFSNKVSGITTLDVTTGSATNVVITADDVIKMGIASGATSHLLTVKMNATESLQIMANGSDHYVYFPGTTDYAFYNASNQEVARIHLVTA